MFLPARFPVHTPFVVLLAALMVVVFAPIPAGAQAETHSCVDKATLTRLSYPLAHMAQRIAAGHSVTIVALGSSSTAGAGASGPAASYPNRLEAELKAGLSYLSGIRAPNLCVKYEELNPSVFIPS
jgi:acyl-CoA thioesterase-1